MRHPGRRWVVPSTLVLLLTLAVPGPTSAQPADPPRPSSAPVAGTYPVTLVTGDELVVEQYPDGRQGITVDPAQRAEPVTFDTIGLDGQTYLLPSDAAPLVPAVLDRELFNVTKLVEYGYTGGVPAIVQTWAPVPPRRPA